MKFSFASGLAMAFGLGWMIAPVAAQQSPTPGLLPLPAVTGSVEIGARPVASSGAYAPVGYFDRYEGPSVPQKVSPPSPPADVSSAPCNNGNGGGSPYVDNGNGYWGGNAVGSSYSDGNGEGGCNSCWFFSARGLYMNRDRENFHQISFDTTNPLGQLLSTHDAVMDWSGGVELRLGKYLCGGEYAVEGVYWGIYPQATKAFAYDPAGVGGLNSVFDFGTLGPDGTFYAPGTTLNDFYDGAQAHCISREWSIHNFEVNVIKLGLQSQSNCCGRNLCVDWFSGFRLFRFDETFLYHTAHDNATFGADPDSEYYYDINVQNTLYGWQFGARADYCLNDCARFHLSPKVGVFGNHMESNQVIYNNNSTAIVGVGNPTAGEYFDIHTTLEDISMVAELDLGIDYRVSKCFSITAGYRAVAVSGLALAANQIPVSFADIPGANNINSNSTVILHGLYVGGEYNW